MPHIKDNEDEWWEKNGWRGAPLERPASNYTREELIERDVRAMVPFIEDMAHKRPEVLMEWLRKNQNSDFYNWLCIFENVDGWEYAHQC
jgi:hypothetical protein